MKKYTHISIYTSLLSIAVFFCSCNSSKLILSWNDASVKLTQYKKVLIIGMLGDKDDALRQDMELDMAEALNAHGMKTESAFEKYGASSFQETNAQLALSEVKNNNYDAIMCIVLVDRKKERKYIQPNVQVRDQYGKFRSSYFDGYDGFRNYYQYGYN